MGSILFAVFCMILWSAIQAVNFSLLVPIFDLLTTNPWIDLVAVVLMFVDIAPLLDYWFDLRGEYYMFVGGWFVAVIFNGVIIAAGTYFWKPELGPLVVVVGGFLVAVRTLLLVLTSFAGKSLLRRFPS